MGEESVTLPPLHQYSVWADALAGSTRPCSTVLDRDLRSSIIYFLFLRSSWLNKFHVCLITICELVSHRCGLGTPYSVRSFSFSPFLSFSRLYSGGG